MQAKTAIIGATSPQGKNTYQSYLMDLVDPESGKKIFNVVELVEVCKKCRESDEPLNCKHKLDMMSGNKSSEKRDITHLFYREEDRHLAMRELMGQRADGSSGRLMENWIKNFSMTREPISMRPRCVYLGIDPGGGGAGELGITGMVEHNGKMMVTVYFSFVSVILNGSISDIAL